MTDQPVTDEVDPLAGLTPKERRFVLEYPIDMVASAAARRAGYAAKSSHVEGSRLLAKANIKAALKSTIDAYWQSQIMDKAEIQARISKRARFTMKGLIKVDADGAPAVDLKAATDDQLDCIEEASLSDTGVLKIKGPNVLGALAHMAKIQGLMKERVEVSVGDEFAATMEAAARRARAARGGNDDES